MKPHHLLKYLGAIGIAAATMPMLDAAPFGSAFTYQGRLNFNGASAADGLYDFRFTLHDAATPGAPVGAAVDVNAVPVSNGLFTAQLDFGAPAFTSGEARWLQLEVSTNGVTPLATLKPRQRLAPTPQAIYAGNAATASAVAPGAVTSVGIAVDAVDGEVIADGSIGAADLAPSLLNGTFWKLGGNAVFPPGPNFLGTLDFRPLEFRANNLPALRLVPNAISPNLLGGHPANHVGLGVSGAFIGGGGRPDSSNVVLNSFATVVGGYRNTAAGEGSFVGGGVGNRVESGAATATIAGGTLNNIGPSAYYSAIGGGYSNHIAANSLYATIAGGYLNDMGTISDYGVIGGGYDNNIAAESYYATIAGGYFNNIGTNSAYSVIGGGGNNNIAPDSFYATIAGGFLNDIGTNSDYGAIGGGYGNSIAVNSEVATIAGGYLNDIGTNSDASAIGGGVDNNIAADSWYATIAGGYLNDIGTDSDYSAIGGGYDNNIAADSSSATIAGGSVNHIGTNSHYSAIGGGLDNNIAANAQYATIPGGRDNTATNFAFAAGRRAKANHSGSFVWADDMDADFASTTNKQFAVRANNGVMIQSANTALDLRGGGGVRVAGAGVNTATPIFTHQATAGNTSGSETRISHPHCNGKPGAILIVTYNYNPAGLAGTRNDRPVGIYYTGTQWAIYNLDAAAMPVGAAYNVLVANP